MFFRTNYNMELTEIKDKYNKAHEYFLKHKDFNGTNVVEAQLLPEVLAFLQEYKPNSKFFVNDDNLLNYCGIDVFEITSDGKVKTWDIKICQFQKEFNVLCDGWKHSDNIYYKATDVKLNDYFLFVNADYFIVLPFRTIENNIPPKEACFYMKRDLYKTTLKFIFDTKFYRKYYKKRKRGE